MKRISTLSYIALMSGVALAIVAIVAVTPRISHADNTAPKGCIDGHGMDTKILDESTILATNGSRNALIKVSGCRLDSFKILSFEYRGTTQICDRLDVDLKLLTSTGTGLGFPEACFVDEVKMITKEEAKALKAAPKSR
jgi:hypothetical protein